MEKLTNLIMIEAYRPSSFDDLIFAEKNKILEYLKEPKAIPSFIFYSSSPGSGKTSCAKLIINTLGCDSIVINSSKDRGIDIIRNDISLFSRGLSFNKNIKKCVFMDESDGMLKAAQDSLRNLIEEYSDNVFFIFTANDLSKIIEPIRSRCVLFNFNKPDKKEILTKLINICELENINFNENECLDILNLYYPDIRSMVMCLQDKKLGGGIEKKLLIFDEALIQLKAKNFDYFKEHIYSQELDLLRFNSYLFKYFFNNYKVYGLDKIGKILLLLADNEKAMNIGVTAEIVVTANLIQIMQIL